MFDQISGHHGATKFTHKVDTWPPCFCPGPPSFIQLAVTLLEWRPHAAAMPKTSKRPPVAPRCQRWSSKLLTETEQGTLDLAPCCLSDFISSLPLNPSTPAARGRYRIDTQIVFQLMGKLPNRLNLLNRQRFLKNTDFCGWIENRTPWRVTQANTTI